MSALLGDILLLLLRLTGDFYTTISIDGHAPTHGASCDDTQWTTQAYTTLGGKSVLYVIIIKKAKILDFNEYYGFNPKAVWVGGGDKQCKKGLLPTQEQLNMNIGPKRRFPGPVSCEFNGITIPTLVFASKGGGVTEDILVAALKHLDDLNVFSRERDLPHPALLVDGHGSRLQPKFLQYINNLKPNWTEDPNAAHRWNVALGLPHATHHWQVADSSQLNQTFKAGCRTAKDALRAHQELNNKTPSIKRHHVIPICNAGFAISFAQEEKVKRAVAVRGWNPLNMNCLLNDEVQRTKIVDESTFNRGKPPSPAELAVLEQGPGVITEFNWEGCVTLQLHSQCGQQMKRLLAQNEEIKARRKKQQERQDAQITFFGRMTSGKLYENGVASVNDPNLIRHMQGRLDKENREARVRDCKRYEREKKAWDQGQEAMATFLDKKEKNPASYLLNHVQLNRLLRFKWSAIEDHLRPRATLLNKTGEVGKKFKMDLWAVWEQQKDPLAPLQPQDYELYLDGVDVEEVMPSADLTPVEFPTMEMQATQETQATIDDNDNSDSEEERQFEGKMKAI